MMERTTVYLPTELKVSIKAAARRQGSSEAQLIRDALEHYVQESERPWPKSFGSVARADVQAEEVDEWLAENWKID
jgi:predicted transcriptional regulator